MYFFQIRVRATQETRQSFSSLLMSGSVRYGWGPTRRCFLKTRKCKELEGESLLFSGDCWWEQGKSLKTGFTVAWLVAPCHLILEANYPEITIHTGCTHAKRGSWWQTQRAVLFAPPVLLPLPLLLPPQSTCGLGASQSTYTSVTLLKCAPLCRTTLCVAVSEAEENVWWSCRKTSVSGELDRG